MTVTYVHVWVKPEYIEKFIEATMANQNESVKEQGNLSFDLTQSADDASKFIIYEAYENDQFAAKHKETQHYKTWRETVADMMLKPRVGEKYSILNC